MAKLPRSVRTIVQYMKRRREALKKYGPSPAVSLVFIYWAIIKTLSSRTSLQTTADALCFSLARDIPSLGPSSTDPTRLYRSVKLPGFVMAFTRLASALAVSASAVHALYINGSVIAPCDSPLYCQGDILKAIQLAQPFSDSKTFVDMYVQELLFQEMTASESP